VSHVPACMKELSIFAGLSPAEKNRVAELARKRVYEPGEFLFHQGDPADTVYLIKSGRIRLFTVSQDGKDFTLGVLHADEMCGENALFQEGLHPFAAQAIEQSFVCSCSKADFHQLLLQNPSIAVKVIQALGQRLNEYTDQMASLALEDVKSRLRRTMQRLARQYGVPTARGIRLEVPLSQQSLASLVGASRVMVANVLKRMRQEGLLDYDGKHYYLREQAERG